MKTMSIWRNQPLEHIIIPKPFITPKKEDFIIELTLELSEPSSYLSDDTTFWASLNEEGYQKLAKCDGTMTSTMTILKQQLRSQL